MKRAARFRRALALPLGLWFVVGSLAGSPSLAAVVVLANSTKEPVTCSLAPVWGETKTYLLAPGKLIAVQVSESLEVTFRSGKDTVTRPVEPNTVHQFTVQKEGVQLERLKFPGSPGSPWLHRDRDQGPPPATVAPVKILVDGQQAAATENWEAAFREELATASRFIQLYCNVRFEVVATGTWKSSHEQKDFAKLEEEFRQQVSPEPGHLALGVTSQYHIGDGSPLRQLPREPLATHLLLPAVQPALSKRDHLKLLVHELCHYLGAGHSAEPASVMWVNLGEKKDDSGTAGATIIDPVNTLVMNLVGEEIRLRQVRTLAAIPRSTRQYLEAIYGEMARRLPQDRDLRRYPTLVQDQFIAPQRYRGRWTDGTTATGDTVAPWNETRSSPTLAGRPLFDFQNPIRWLVDETLPVAETPKARIELVGGDCLPGRVLGYSSGEETSEHRLPPHLLVAPYVSFAWPDDPAESTVRVTTNWVRRIVWTPVASAYKPSTLFYPDGREVSFRGVRFGESSVKLLCDDGIREAPLADVAELHLPAQDDWEAYFEQLTVLSPDGTARLVQLETTGGLRLTGSEERFQARARSGEPSGWYHLYQPAWSLDPFWLQHTTIRVRRFYLPHEVPLSRIAPVAARQQSDLGGVWPWQADRNCEGGPMETGGNPYQWGFGVHAFTELEFPLPACARTFRTHLGLDRLARDGGCVRASIHVVPSEPGHAAQSEPGRVAPIPGRHGPARKEDALFTSPLIVSSADVLDTGRLTLNEATSRGPRRLVLSVDPAQEQRPSGADPFDIRDHFNWLEPLVTLDAAELKAELLRRAWQRIPAFEHWKVATGDRAEARLVNHWDETDPRQRVYRLLTASSGAPLELVRRLKVTAQRDQLVIAVSRPRETSASKLEVLVDGQLVKQFEVPVRWDKNAPKPLVVSLADQAGREVTVTLVHRGTDDRALAEWRALALVGASLPSDARGETLPRGASAAATGAIVSVLTSRNGVAFRRWGLDRRLRHHVQERGLAGFRLVVGQDRLGGGQLFQGDGAMGQESLGLVGQVQLPGTARADEDHLGPAFADFFQFLRADGVRIAESFDDFVDRPFLHLAVGRDEDIPGIGLVVDRHFALAGLGDDRILWPDDELLLEWAASHVAAGQRHGAEHDGVVAQGREANVSRIAGAGQGVGADDVFHDGQHEFAAGLDHAAAQDDRLGIDQVPDRDARMAEHFAGSAHDLGNQRILLLQGAAQRAGTDHRQIAVEDVGQHGRSPGGHGVAQVALDGRSTGQGFKAAAVAAAAAWAVELHHDVADLAGGVPSPAPQFPFAHEPGADSRADEDRHDAAGAAARAEPGFAQRAEVAIVAQNDRHAKMVFQVRAEGHAGEIHVGGDNDAARLGVGHPGHGDADPRERVGDQVGLVEHLVDDLFQGGDDLLGAPFPGRGRFFAGNNRPAFFGQGSLDFRPPDIDAKV